MAKEIPTEELPLIAEMPQVGRYNNVKMGNNNLAVERILAEEMQQDITAEKSNTLCLQHQFNL